MRVEANGKNKRFVMAHALTVPEMEDCIRKRMSDYEIGKKYRCSALTAAGLRERIMADRNREIEATLARAETDALISKIADVQNRSMGDGSQHSEDHIQIMPTRIPQAA